LSANICTYKLVARTFSSCQLFYSDTQYLGDVLKPELIIPGADLADTDIPFMAVPAGEHVVLMARIPLTKFEELCVANCDAADRESNGDIEAEETTDGYSA
jgi:hypothetical protein